jgi:AcrR family transcriptional regulator
LFEAEILEKAERLFAERGFAGTNLADIAEATGLTRPALYHYVRSKEDLLSKVLARVTQSSVIRLGRVTSQPGATATDKLRALARDLAASQARQPDRFRMVLRSEADLPSELAASYDEGRRKVLAVVVRVIDEGIRNGEFRSVDARVAALGVIGMCNWVAWWYRPGGDKSPEEVAAELADMAVAALVDPRADEKEPDGPRRALKRLQQDVEYLSRVLPG